MPTYSLPRGTFPSDYGDRLKSIGLGNGLAFGGSDLVDSSGHTPDEIARALALADTPLGVSTSDAARFLGQQGMPIDITGAGVGGGTEPDTGGATPGGGRTADVTTPDASSFSFSMPSFTGGNLGQTIGTIGGGLLGGLAGAFGGPAGSLVGTTLGGKLGGYLGGKVGDFFSGPPNVTPTPQIDPFSEEQDPNMPDMPNEAQANPDFSPDVDAAGGAAGSSPSSGPAPAGPGPGPGPSGPSGEGGAPGDSGGGGEGGLRRGGRVPSRSLMPARGFGHARKFRQGGYTGGDSSDIGPWGNVIPQGGLGNALDFVSDALRAPSCGPGGGYSRGGPVRRGGAIAPRAPESARAARARRVREFETRFAHRLV
jgi:hypothetical protein